MYHVAGSHGRMDAETVLANGGLGVDGGVTGVSGAVYRMPDSQDARCTQDVQVPDTGRRGTAHPGYPSDCHRYCQYGHLLVKLGSAVI